MAVGDIPGHTSTGLHWGKETVAHDDGDLVTSCQQLTGDVVYT